MALIDWSEDLRLGVTFMDDDHIEFIDLVNRMNEAEGADFAALYDELLHHTEEHFERENELMRQVGFFAYVPHSGEHARVVAEMTRLKAQIAGGNDSMARAFVQNYLPEWFMRHRDTMDAATAAFAQAATAA